ncbi:MAG: hypothetical protein ACPGAD_07570, partial [Pseudomonadales bacterium]
VVETYEKGLRAVPLCVFLNDRYISYAEVYRHRELLDGAPAEASALAHDALAEAAECERQLWPVVLERDDAVAERLLR